MGGSSGGGGRTPYEAPDSGRSKQRVRIVEVVSEGEVQGLVDGVKSVYLDNTPIQNQDGSYNFTNIQAEGRIGTQDQSVMKGFQATEKEISVGTEVRKKTAITRTVTDAQVSRLRLTLGVSSLFHQNDEGDTYGSEVDFIVTVGTRTYSFHISGKYSSQYLKNLMIDELPPVPFKIKVERVQDDSTSQRLQNKTIWASYTEIIDAEFAYPNTALVGIKFDSEYFSNIPTRSYEIYGIKIKVPSNYDPVTRAYTGLWDGTYKIAYSDNPVFILMDFVTNKRYGLGQRLGEFGVDKWALYQAAQYCDQMIPDGYGSTRPRFTCNAWITEQRSAYDVINDICSIFRAMPVWNGTELTVIMDRPSDPVWTYTNANVINGEFARQYSAVKARHNAIQVEYQDAANNYEKTIEYVSNDDDIRKYGLNLKKVVAFGCTNRGQAYCTGRWILETERLETETITFSVGAEGLMHIPGDIIRVSDNDYADMNIGGRVLAINGRKVTLDREIQLSGNSHLSYINAEAKHSDIKILSVKDNVVTLENDPVGLAEMGVWSLTTQTITSRLYRAMTVTENDNGSYTIVALQHEPQKEAIVDNGASFEPINTTNATAGLSKPNNINLQADGDGIALSFEYVAQNSAMVKYQIKLYKDGKFYKIYDDLTSPEIKFIGLPDGNYVAEIRAKNGHGQLSEPVSKSFSIQFAVNELVAVSKVFGIGLSWKNPIFANQNAAIEIWVSKENRFETARKLVSLAYPTNSYTYDGLGIAETYYFWARMVDNLNGTAGEFTPVTEGITERSAEKLVDYLEGQLTKDSFSQQLLDGLTKDIRDEIGENNKGIDSKLSQITHGLQQEVANRTAEIQREAQQRTQALQAEARTRGTAIAQLQNVDQTQAQQISQATAKADDALAGVQAERTARIEANRAETVAREALTGRVANAESGLTSLQRTVTQQGQSIAESSQRLNAKIDGLSVGGVNLLKDSEYRHSSLIWDPAAARKDQSTYKGKYVTRITARIDGSAQYGIVQAVNKSSRVQGGETYTLSLNVQGTTGFVKSGLNYVHLIRDQSEGDNYRLPVIPLTNSLRARPKVTFTAPWSSDTVRILIGAHSDKIKSDDWFAFHSVKLERGTVATDWSPAPEDVEQSISAVAADLKEYKSAQATKEQAQTQKVNDLTARLGSAEGNISNIQSTKASKTEVASIARTALRSEWQSDAQALAESAKNQAITATDAKISTLASTVATNQEAMTASVNQLKASLGQASGANLLPNANFKKLSNNFPVGWGLYNNSGASQAASHIIVPGIDGSNAVKLTWSGVNSTTKGLYILHSNPSTFEVGQYYVLAVCARVPEGQPQDGRIALHYSNAPGWVDWRMVSQPTLSHQWQWTVMVARKPPHANGAYNQWYVSVENYTGQAVELCLPYASKGETWLGYKAGDLSAEINDERQARVTSDTALSNRIDTITASVNDTKAQISSVSNVVAGVDGKVQAIHSLRTETIANGRKAIAGITLGSNGGEQSEIILMADKLQLVRNAQDGSPVPVFTVAQNRVAIRGDLIADHTILGRHLKANETITSPRINGGEIVGNNISGSTVTGSTINGGVIRGARIEGVTGKFTGELEVTQLTGGNIFDFGSFNAKYVRQERRGQYAGGRSVFENYKVYRTTIFIPKARVRRRFRLTQEPRGYSRDVVIPGFGSNPQPQTVHFPAWEKDSYSISPQATSGGVGVWVLEPNKDYTATCEVWCLGDDTGSVAKYECILFDQSTLITQL